MTKNKKLVYGILMIVISISIATICITLSKCIQKKPIRTIKTEFTTQKTDMLEIEKMADACYESYQIAVSKGLNLYMKREQCYVDIAVRLKDVLICEKIKDQGIKDMCLNDVGCLLEDSSICEKIINDKTKSYCFYKIGLKKNDLFLCSKILNWEWRISCYKNAKLREREPSFCNDENIKNDKDFCLYIIAAERKDPIICKDISINDKNHAHTIDNCIEAIAKEDKNPITCSYMENNYNKLDCYNYIAPFKNEEVEFCQNKLSNTFDKDMCFKAIASIKKDSSICVNVIDKAMRESCKNNAN